MRTFKLNKLVRDKIVADMQQQGQRVTFRKLNDAEYRQALANKLLEETNEFKIENKEDALMELADVLEVIEALAAELGVNFDKLRTLQADRNAKRGGFKERLFVEKVELEDTDKWVDYYTSEPERFKEIK